MNWDIIATIVSTMVGVVGTFIGAGMLWVASSLRDDVKELNRLVTSLTAEMIPREESDRKRKELEDKLHAEVRDVRAFVEDTFGGMTDPNLRPRRK